MYLKYKTDNLLKKFKYIIVIVKDLMEPKDICMSLALLGKTYEARTPL